MIYKSWHLCIPPLLTLVDDPSTPIRVRGLAILLDLLSKTPPNVLNQTGLGEVFEDAVMPTLHFLPSLTPTGDSLKLLKPAYAVLLKLGEIQFPARGDQHKRLRLLDRVMREG